MRRFPIAIAAALPFAAGLPIASAPATVPAPRVQVDLDYRVYYAGARVGGMVVDIGLGPRAYEMKMHLETVGLAGKLFPWWMNAHSRGSVDGTGVTPGAAGQRNQWRGKDRWVELRYREGEAIIIGAEPAPDEDDRDAVNGSMRRNTLDLASAVLRVILSMDRGRRCGGSIPVFDGRRRYDMVLRHHSTERLSATSHSPYSGPAESCAVTMKRIGGFKRDDDRYGDGESETTYGYDSDRGRGWREEDRHAHIWIGRVFADAPPMPVRLELDTPYGTLRAHLYEAEADVGGDRRRLAVGK